MKPIIVFLLSFPVGVLALVIGTDRHGLISFSNLVTVARVQSIESNRGGRFQKRALLVPECVIIGNASNAEISEGFLVFFAPVDAESPTLNVGELVIGFLKKNARKTEYEFAGDANGAILIQNSVAFTYDIRDEPPSQPLREFLLRLVPKLSDVDARDQLVGPGCHSLFEEAEPTSACDLPIGEDHVLSASKLRSHCPYSQAM